MPIDFHHSTCMHSMHGCHTNPKPVQNTALATDAVLKNHASESAQKVANFAPPYKAADLPPLRYSFPRANKPLSRGVNATGAALQLSTNFLAPLHPRFFPAALSLSHMHAMHACSSEPASAGLTTFQSQPLSPRPQYSTQACVKLIVPTASLRDSQADALSQGLAPGRVSSIYRTMNSHHAAPTHSMAQANNAALPRPPTRSFARTPTASNGTAVPTPTASMEVQQSGTADPCASQQAAAVSIAATLDVVTPSTPRKSKLSNHNVRTGETQPGDKQAMHDAHATLDLFLDKPLPSAAVTGKRTARGNCSGGKIIERAQCGGCGGGGGAPSSHTSIEDSSSTQHVCCTSKPSGSRSKTSYAASRNPSRDTCAGKNNMHAEDEGNKGAAAARDNTQIGKASSLRALPPRACRKRLLTS